MEKMNYGNNAINFDIDINNQYKFKHILYLIDIEDNLDIKKIQLLKKILLSEYHIGDAVYFINSIPIKKYYYMKI